MIKKISKILLIIIGIIVLLVAGFVLWLSINEFNPEPVSDVAASFLVGLYVSEVKYSVERPISTPAISPEMIAK